MAGELLILSPRVSDLATITGSSTAANMPWTNLLTPYPHEPARSASLSSVFFQLDLGALMFFNPPGGGQTCRVHIWLGGTNLRQEFSTWRVRTDDDSDPTVGPDTDTGTVAFVAAVSEIQKKEEDWEQGLDGYITVDLGQSDIRYIRVDLADSLHPDGFLQASRVVVAFEPVASGGNFEPLDPFNGRPTTTWRSQKGALYSSELVIEEPEADGERADGGQFYAFEREAPVGAAFEFSAMDPIYIRWLRSLLRERGAAKDIVAILDPQHTNTGAGAVSNQENTVWGYLRDVSRPTRQRTSAEKYQLRIGVESIYG